MRSKTLGCFFTAVFAFAMGANMSAEARSITGVERVASAGAISLNVTFEAGEPGDEHALYIAYDTEDKGADISNWAALQRGCVVAADATSATIPVSSLLTGTGYTFCRVFLTTSAAPYDTLIEYLRQTSASKQYIDTGIKPNGNSAVAVIDVKLDSNATEQQRFFGVSGNSANFSFDCYINGSKYFASACNDGNGDWKSTGTYTADRVRILLSAADKHRIIITNVVTGAEIFNKKYDTTCSKSSAGNLLVLARTKVASSSSKTPSDKAAGANLYSFTMTQGGSCVCDYKPCKLGNRVGVYDAVNGNIRYSNSGTDFDAANSGSPVECSLLAGETQLAAAPAVTELLSDFIWSGTSPNWGDANAWTKDGDPATWVAGNNAIFETANATATLAADVTARKLVFSEDATVSGSATLTAPTVSVDSGVAATISAPTAGALEKTGAGTLTLTENRADATTVTEGFLKMYGATVAGLTLGTNGGAPVTFDYGGQELVKITRDYLVTGSIVTLTNGIFSTASGDDLNIRDDTFTMPSVLTIAKDAVVRQGATGKSVFINNTLTEAATINVIGGTLGNTSGCSSAYIQHKSPDSRLNINVTEGGLVYLPCTVNALCGNNTVRTTPSLYMAFDNSAFIAGTFNFGNIYNSHDYAPTSPTAVFAATNSVVSVANDFIVGRDKQDSKTDGSYRVDFEGSIVTAKTFTVYYDRPLNNARFNDTRFVFNAASGSIAASDDEDNWFTVGAGGLTLDTQDYSATLNANLGGSGAVTKVGAGTLTVARDQTSTAAFNVGEGVLAVNGGVSVSRPIAVASGATLSINAADTASVSNLTLAAGSTLNIASYTLGVMPLAVATSATLPESGTVNLTMDGGAFGEGVYAIFSAPGVTAADGDKFSFDLAIADLIPTWSVEDGALVLTVRATAQTWNGAAGESVSWAEGWTGGAWVETHDAMFNTAGAIASVDADVSANSVQFNESATVNGSATLTPNVVFVAEGKEATISAPTAGALEKTGAGTLTLAANRTDATTVTEGTLKMAGATVAGLTLGTDGGAPVTFDYGGQTLTKVSSDYLVTGSTVTLTNGVFETASGDDLNIRDDTFTMPSVLTIAKDAVIQQGATGKSIYINNTLAGAATINVIGGTLGNTSGCSSAYLQHKSPAGRLNINVAEGGILHLPCTVNVLCGNNTTRTTPSIYMTFADSMFSAGTLNFGTTYSGNDYVPTNPTAVFAATNSVVSIDNGFYIGRNGTALEGKTDGSYTIDFEGSTVTAKTFAVYYDRPLNNARFNNTRFVFGAASGSIAASDDEDNWFTVGADGLTIDTQTYSETLNANLGGSGAVTKVGAGTLTLARDQTSTAAFNVGEGTLALNAGLTVNRPIAVASGATLSVNAAGTASVANLALANGSTLNITSYNGITPFTVGSLTLPESGSVTLTLNGGAFTKGVYAIYSKSGVTAEDGAKFAPSTGELGYSWSVEDGTLVLTVGEVSGNYWTGRAGDGRMSTAANWLNGVPAAGDDIDLSFISSATTIIADADRTFGAVTMGTGVITFTNAMAATSFSDTSKITVGVNSIVTIVGDLVMNDQPSNVIVNKINAGGKFIVTGRIVSTNKSIEVANDEGTGDIIVNGIEINGNDKYLYTTKDKTSQKWAIGSQGITGTGSLWCRKNTLNDTWFYAYTNDFTISAWTVLRDGVDYYELNTTGYGDNLPHTITLNAGFADKGALYIAGTGKVVVNSELLVGKINDYSAYSGNVTVLTNATLAINAGKALTTTGKITVNSGATLQVAESAASAETAAVTLGGNLTLQDNASLGFNFTGSAAPSLALASGKTLSFVEGISTNITVKVSGSAWPRGGETLLTTCGGFGAEGVTVSLAAGAPKWATDLTVNGDGNIVLSVKPKGTIILIQ